MLKISIKKIIYNSSFITVFLFAILLRTYSFISFRPLWRDECNLALSIYFGNFSDLWGLLFHVQSAPPLFMTLSKIFNTISPLHPEYSLRIVPFFAGLVSIYLFFLLSKKFFTSKPAIIFSNFFFAVNSQLIYYSHEFKQYSVDVAVVLWCVLHFSKLDISDITKKQLFINTLLLVVLPLLSFPSLFVIAAWFLISLLDKNNIKKTFLLFTPSVFSNFLYYIFILKPSYNLMLENFGSLWQKGFLSFDLNTIADITKTNLSFYFEQCEYIIIPAVLIFAGLIYLCKRKLKIDKLLILSLVLVVIASYLSIYPIHERTSLYLLPFVILFMLAPLDFSKRNILKIIFLILLSFILFSKNNYRITTRNSENPSLMMKVLKSKYQNDDFIIYNDASDSQFEIYSYIYNMNIPKNKTAKLQLSDYGEQWYYNVLDTLPKGKRYWFFYSYDIKAKPVVPFLINWIHKNAKTLYELYPNEKSCLLYVEL